MAMTLDAIVRRDRLLAGLALATVALAAWAYVLWLAYAGMDMGMDPGPPAAPMDMPGMNMDAKSALSPAFAPWGAGQFVAMFVMWSAMMIGMMTPSAAPMILLYARVGRAADAQRKPFAPTSFFAAGYLAAWTGFSLLATGAQWALERAALLSPAMAANSNRIGGALLVAAGVYEMTPLKRACLAHCRAPLAFLQERGGFRRGARGAFLFGAHHGLYCIGCCWALMALLFVGGVMNILWIAGLTVLVLAEKALPYGAFLSTAAGVALIGAGLVMLFM